jgi:hypothetical protein
MKKTSSEQAPTKPTKSPNKHADLKRRINEAQRLIQELKDELRKRDGKTDDAKKLPRIPLWILIRDYLREQDNEESVDNIVKDLLNAGHDLGKYPLRSVKVTVASSHMRSIFAVTKLESGTEMVKLVEGTAGPYTPISYRRQS